MAYGYRPQRPGTIDPNDPRRKRLPLTPEEDPSSGIVPDLGIEFPMSEPLPVPPLTPGIAAPRAPVPAPVEGWQTPPANLTALRAWYSGAAKVPGAPPTPEWGKETPTYSRLNPPPPKTSAPSAPSQPVLQPGVQRTVSGVPVGPKGFTPTMPTAPMQGFQARPGAMPSLPVQPPMPTADRQRFTLAEAERRAMLQESAGQGAGQYLQEAGMAPFVKQPRGLADLAKEAFIRQAGGAAGLATGGVQRTPGETLRDQYLAIKAGIPQAGATALNFMDVLGRSATAGAPVGQPGAAYSSSATYSPSPATVTPSPVFGYTARGLQQASQDILGQRSPAIQRREQQAEAELARSQDNALEQVARFALQVYKDPALAEKHILTNLPMMAPGLAAGKVMQTAARVSRLATAEQAAGLGAATARVLGGAMTASDAQTTAYENIKQALMGRGIPEKDADQEAFRKSLLSFGIGAVLGTAGAMTGAEATAFGGAAQGVRGRLQRAAMEPVTELGEELGPLVASNIQAGLPAMQNVGQTVGATLLATAPFAGIAAIGRPDGGTSKVPDALQTEGIITSATPQWPTETVEQARQRVQRTGRMREALQPRTPEEQADLNRQIRERLYGKPSDQTGDLLNRPTPPVEPPLPPTTETAAPLPPGISFKYGWGAGARPVEALDRVPEQLALRTMRGPEVMAEVQPELEARRAQGEQITARDVRRPKTEPAYIAEAINKTSTRVLKKVAPAYGIETANIDEAAGDVLTNIAREMSEMDNREYTVADIRGAVRLQTGKAAKLAGDERSTLWSRWNEQYGKKMGLSDREYTDLQNLAAGNYGFTFRPDVQAILLGDVGEPYANKRVMEVIRQDIARLMGLPAEDYPSLSLTTVPPNTWRNWALVRKLDVIAPEAYRELMEAVERGPRLKTMTRGERQPSGPTGETPPPPTGPTPPPAPPTPPTGGVGVAPVTPSPSTGKPSTRKGGRPPATPTTGVPPTVTPPAAPTPPSPAVAAPTRPQPVRPGTKTPPAQAPTTPSVTQRKITQKDAQAAGWSQQQGGDWSGPNNTTIERVDRANKPWVYTDTAGNRTGYDTLSEALRDAIQQPTAVPQPAETAPPPKAKPRKKPKPSEPPVAPEPVTPKPTPPAPPAPAGEAVTPAVPRPEQAEKAAISVESPATSRIRAVLKVLRSPTYKYKDFTSIDVFGDRDAGRIRQKAIQVLTGRSLSAQTATFKRLLDELAAAFNMQPASKNYQRAIVHINNALERFESGETEIAETFTPQKRPPFGYVPPVLPESERVGASALDDNDLMELIVYGMRQIEPNLSFDTFVPISKLREFFKNEFPTQASFDAAILRLSATQPLRFTTPLSIGKMLPSPSISVFDPLSKKYWTGVTFDEDFAPNALTLYKGKSPEALLGKKAGKPAAKTEAKPDKAGKVQTAPDDVKQVFATLDSPQGSKARVRKMIKGTYPEIGPKAIFINDNIEQIIAEAEANGKVTKECP